MDRIPTTIQIYRELQNPNNPGPKAPLFNPLRSLAPVIATLRRLTLQHSAAVSRRVRGSSVASIASGYVLYNTPRMATFGTHY